MNSGVTVRVYGDAWPDGLPADLALALEHQYGNIFATLAYARTDGGAGPVLAYVARQGRRTLAILLFRRSGNAVRVLNHAVTLEHAEVARFVATVFSRWSEVTAVTFHAIGGAAGPLPWPQQRYNCLENIVLTLPSGQQAYLDSLGKNLRTSLQRYHRKLARERPALRFVVVERAAIGEPLIRQIIGLSMERMRAKRQRSLHTDTASAQLVALARSHGCVVVALQDGRVCAGVICSAVGGNYFMHVIAHAADFDAYRLGKLCCHEAIAAAIGRGGREFHFLWGRAGYKYRFGGVQRELDRLTVYRSAWSRLRHLRLVLNNAWRGHGRRLKRYLLAPERARCWHGRLARWYCGDAAT